MFSYNYGGWQLNVYTSKNPITFLTFLIRCHNTINNPIRYNILNDWVYLLESSMYFKINLMFSMGDINDSIEQARRNSCR